MKKYVTILEDLLLKLQINVAVAKGFKSLEFPQKTGQNTKKYIDLWPIQMSAQIAADAKIMTTNFDTYTLILQLGCILDTVPRWKKAYKLRVAVFVEYEIDVEEERCRVRTLLENLRIQAEVLVFWLASGDLKTYQIIINGDLKAAGEDAAKLVDETLKDEEWWRDVQNSRGRRGTTTATEELVDAQSLLSTVPTWPSSSFQQGRAISPARRFENIRKMVRNSRRRRSSSDLNGMGLSMQTHRLDDDVLHRHASHASASEEEESSSESDSEAIESDDADPFEERPLGSPDSVKNERSSGQVTSRTWRRRQSSERAQEINLPTHGNPSLTITPDHYDNFTVSDTDFDESQAPYPQPIPKPFAARPAAITSTEDGLGPSIMFTDNPPTPPKNSPSIYAHHSTAPAPAPATGFPLSQSTPLGFNDLPCRAQHLYVFSIS